ncbi:hypothetical protein AAFF_G00064170 [Aldrovandia affinis]|uniref:Uncharacterized protein n=1 Tax=Aldrovandia affinis TaxID=143900 RepID=A0AAD7WZF7_9TELE|nr:hypothetical protein AAFF_G00064170 [Aldrovandia affinis]
MPAYVTSAHGCPGDSLNGRAGRWGSAAPHSDLSAGLPSPGFNYRPRPLPPPPVREGREPFQVRTIIRVLPLRPTSSTSGCGSQSEISYMPFSFLIDLVCAWSSATDT